MAVIGARAHERPCVLNASVPSTRIDSETNCKTTTSGGGGGGGALVSFTRAEMKEKNRCGRRRVKAVTFHLLTTSLHPRRRRRAYTPFPVAVEKDRFCIYCYYYIRIITLCCINVLPSLPTHPPLVPTLSADAAGSGYRAEYNNNNNSESALKHNGVITTHTHTTTTVARERGSRRAQERERGSRKDAVPSAWLCGWGWRGEDARGGCQRYQKMSLFTAAAAPNCSGSRDSSGNWNKKSRA